MPPRVAFALARDYTPAYEAVSREIAALRAPHAAVAGLLPLAGRPWHHRIHESALAAHPLAMRLHPWTARAVRGCEVLHAFAPLPLPRRMGWLPRARAELLTAISVPARVDARSLGRYRIVVAECARDLERLRDAGLDEARTRCIEPFAQAIELDPPRGEFCAAFASWPFRTDEAHARGLDLIAEAARSLPELRFRLLLRPQSQVGAEAFAGLANVELVDEVLHDAAAIWGPAHVALAVFRGDGKSKSAPNSILEAIAAGRPAIVSEDVGISRELAAGGAALRIPADADALCAALLQLRDDYARAREAARTLRARFSLEGFRARYAELYDELG